MERRVVEGRLDRGTRPVETLKSAEGPIRVRQIVQSSESR
jgi:hypothetical protein